MYCAATIRSYKTASGYISDDARTERHVGCAGERLYRCLPGTLNDLPVGMWEIVPSGRFRFGLEGQAIADFIRRCIYYLMDAGAKPVAGGGKLNHWKLQNQYGSSKHGVAEAVIQEWQRQGA